MQFFEAASRGRPASTIQRLGVGLPRPRESESVRHQVLDFLILHCQQFFNPKLQIMRSENLGFRSTLPAVFFSHPKLEIMQSGKSEFSRVLRFLQKSTDYAVAKSDFMPFLCFLYQRYGLSEIQRSGRRFGYFRVLETPPRPS